MLPRETAKVVDVLERSLIVNSELVHIVAPFVGFVDTDCEAPWKV